MVLTFISRCFHTLSFVHVCCMVSETKSSRLIEIRVKQKNIRLFGEMGFIRIGLHCSSRRRNTPKPKIEMVRLYIWLLILFRMYLARYNTKLFYQCFMTVRLGTQKSSCSYYFPSKDNRAHLFRSSCGVGRSPASDVHK